MPIIRFYNITLHSNYLCDINDQHMDDNNDFKKTKIFSMKIKYTIL